MIDTKRILLYPISLLLSTHKKTAEGLAQLLGISGDTALRILKDECTTWEELVDRTKHYFGTDRVSVIIDDSLIKKMHSKFIAGSSDNYDPVTKQTYRSICTVVALLTNGKEALPVVHNLWINREFSQDQYQTKVSIAQDLIEKLSTKVSINIVLMDGLYATFGMIRWLNKRKLYFEMRFHANRIIATNFGILDYTVRISECKELKLKGKKRCRTIKNLWKGELVYVTSVKRYTKDGFDRIVYQISNCPLLARDHVKAYDIRWYVEKFFRTAKQHLGLADCQSRKKYAQENHIYNVFFAYAILQAERKKMKCKTPEEALHKLKSKKSLFLSI
jgi:DDE superfamily endonuclease